jgi:hypothetical protein
VPYPNPVKPGIGVYISFIFDLNRTDYESLGIRIFTASSRLIRDTNFPKADANIVNNRILRYDTGKYLMGLSNGTYYYYLYAKKGGEVTRSRIDKFIIIK